MDDNNNNNNQLFTKREALTYDIELGALYKIQIWTTHTLRHLQRNNTDYRHFSYKKLNRQDPPTHQPTHTHTAHQSAVIN